MPRGTSQLGGGVNRAINAKARPSGTKADKIGARRSASNRQMKGTPGKRLSPDDHPAP